MIEQCIYKLFLKNILIDLSWIASFLCLMLLFGQAENCISPNRVNLVMQFLNNDEVLMRLVSSTGTAVSVTVTVVALRSLNSKSSLNTTTSTLNHG